MSIRQPWAWLVANGHKAIENRSWSTSYRGPLLIHAGRQPDETFVKLLAAPLAQVALPETLDYGGIVGVVELVGCVTTSDDPWFVGPVGWVIADARPVPFVRWPGRLGLFDVPWPPEA